MPTIHLILDRVFNVPHLCTDGKLSAILEVVTSRADFAVELPEVLFSTGTEEDAKETGPMKIADGLALLPMRGTFTQRVGGLHPSSGMVGYNQIADMYDIALADKSVKHIAFMLDSHGGEGSGAIELYDYMNGLRGKKPTTAIVNTNALSAGYLMACAADKIVMPEFGKVGSIGVVMAHMDRSEQLKKEGVKVTYVYAGKHKIDGAGSEPLSEAARAEAQTQVNAMYDAFTSRVAASRGISQDAVKKTEALIFSGRDAISMSLADELAGERQALASVKARASASRWQVTVPKIEFHKV